MHVGTPSNMHGKEIRYGWTFKLIGRKVHRWTNFSCGLIHISFHDEINRKPSFVLYLIIVPSFWVIYKGHFKPSSLKAPQNAFTVRWQSGFRLSLSTAAFSRSRSPIRPTSWERVILMAGQTDLMIAPTWSSCFPETGEKTPTMTTFLIPRSNRNHWYQQIPPRRVWKCANEWTTFQHSKRNLGSPSDLYHVIFPICHLNSSEIKT